MPRKHKRCSKPKQLRNLISNPRFYLFSSWCVRLLKREKDNLILISVAYFVNTRRFHWHGNWSLVKTSLLICTHSWNRHGNGTWAGHESTLLRKFDVNVICVCQWWAVRKLWPYPISLCFVMTLVELWKETNGSLILLQCSQHGKCEVIYLCSVVFMLCTAVYLIEM